MLKYDPMPKKNSQELLQEIHEKMITRFQKKNISKRDVNDAKTLQQFFDETFTKLNNELQNPTSLSQYITALNIDNDFKNILLGSSDLPDFLKNAPTETEKGARLEKLVEGIISQGIAANSPSVNVAYNTMQIDFNTVAKQEGKAVLDKTYKLIKEKNFNDDGILGKDARISPHAKSLYIGVQQKIDIDGTNLRYSNSTKIDSKIQRLLKKSTFTIKNYSYRKIGFDTTNPVRVFTAAARYCYRKWTARNINTRFWRFYNCLEEHDGDGTHPDTKMYYYKIKVLYGITGFGQDKTGKGARFLLWWDGTKKQIIVIPTMTIIAAIYKDIDDDNNPSLTTIKDILFKEVSMSAADLRNIN